MAAGHEFVARDFPIAFAHRGGAREAPENTMEAFRYAASLGFGYFETDAQLTADGIPIAFHDPQIDRVTDRTGAISDMTWDELRDLTIHREINGGGHLATIQQLLEELPRHFFNIDAKSAEVVAPLVDTVVAANALNRVCFASFFDHRLGTIRKLGGPETCTSAGPFEVATSFVQSLFGRASATGRPQQVPSRVYKFPVVTKRFVDFAHEMGSHVHVWTIDDTNEMHRLLDLGVDGIMTDRPTVLRQVLIERGQWEEH